MVNNSLEKKITEDLEKSLNGWEDAISAEMFLNDLKRKVGDNNYIGFCFHGGALHNLRLLNSLSKVIPTILKFEAHEGLIYCKFANGVYTEFSGDTTQDIIESLINFKITFENGNIKRNN